MNNWNFTGNLGRDAEHLATPGGESVVKFSVGVKSGYGDKATTTWANCSLWGKRGEAVAKYLVKGQLVGISGEVALNEYTGRDSVQRVSLHVRVSDLTLLGRKSEGGTHAPRSESAPRQGNGGGHPPPQNSFDEFDDDIPF